jgi:hypothetical protein
VFGRDAMLSYLPLLYIHSFELTSVNLLIGVLSQ